jgi:L-ascorbate metabolism protein UlaG (beta-lactamase superfamily)
MNLAGVNILTDPVFSARAGIWLGIFTLGPKRYVAPALSVRDLPRIDLILLSHAHMDHFDIRSLKRLNRNAVVVTAKDTRDLLHGMRFKQVVELVWNESAEIETSSGKVKITAFPVKHWGARMRHDDHRGYNGYLLERAGRRVFATGDTAFTKNFAQLKSEKPIDLMLVPIGAYDPWINSHCNPEEAVAMADLAGANYVMPIHHQTFKLSREPMDEPIRRFQKALAAQPERVALTEIGGTFVLPAASSAK